LNPGKILVVKCCLCDQLVGTKTIFFHIGFAVDAVLGKTSATDHAAVVAADSATDIGDVVLTFGLSSAIT